LIILHLSNRPIIDHPAAMRTHRFRISSACPVTARPCR